MKLWFVLFLSLAFARSALAGVAGIALYNPYVQPVLPPPAPPPPATNFVPNSSFEVGTGHGWVAYGSFSSTTYGNETSIAGRLRTNNAFHGNNSLQWRTRVVSPPMALSNGTYTASFYMMANTPNTVYWTNVGIAYDTVHDPANGTPFVPLSVTTSWARYTFPMVINSPTNTYYSLKFYCDDSPTNWIDAVQVEYGASATPYAPQVPVLMGLTTSDINNVLLSADTKEFQMRFWNNTGTNTSASANYLIYDFWNSNIVSGTVASNSLAPGLSIVSIALPAGRTGWLRVMAYQPTVADSWDELILSVFPYAASTAQDTNGIIGSHPDWSPYGVVRDRRLGYTYSRDLSPAGLVRMNNVNPSRGVFDWNSGGAHIADYGTPSFTTNGTVPLLVLTPGLDGAWPAWAITGGNEANILDWSNYCYTVANRYYPSNMFHYEIGNEWHNITSNSVADHPTEDPAAYNPTVTDFLGLPKVTEFVASSNRARFMVAGAQAVRAAAPNATILGISGENIAARAWMTWTQMTVGERGLFNIISAHLYPLNAGANNPNNNDDDIGSAQSALAWRQLFLGVKPIWVSEFGGQGQVGGFLGPSSTAYPLFHTYGPLVPEAGRDWQMGQRKVVSVGRETRQMVRLFGLGFEKVMNYTSQFNDDRFWQVNFKAGNQEISGAPKQGTTAHLIAARQFVRTGHAGLGRLTNASSVYVEAYMFTNDLGTVVGLWSNDMLPRTLTASRGEFGIFDVMGNLLATNSVVIQIDQIPTYLVSGNITTAQLSNAVVTAVAVTNIDVTGPSISIDVSPVAAIPTGRTNFLKWTLTDRNRQAWSIPESPPTYQPDETNNRSRIKFAAGDPWIDVGVSNHFWKAFTVAGVTNQLIVEGRDYWNRTNVTVGPLFWSY